MLLSPAASPVKPSAEIKEALWAPYDSYNRKHLLVERGYRSFPDWLEAS